MRSARFLRTLALAATLGAPFAAAQAQTASTAGIDSVAEPSTRIGIGAALLVANDGYRGVGTDTQLIPGLSIVNKWVTLFGPNLDFRLIGPEDRRWWLGLRLEYRSDGYEPEDGAIFNGMAKRRGGIFGGLSGSIEFDNDVEISADFVRSTRRDQGFSKGRVASIELARTWRQGSWSFKPRVGLEWADADHIGYYYGVRPSEATATRPAYNGRSASSLELGLDVRWQLDRRQTLFANFNDERYPNVIRNSPLIAASGIPQVVLGYQYLLR
jgi:MipA family protein